MEDVLVLTEFLLASLLTSDNMSIASGGDGDDISVKEPTCRDHQNQCYDTAADNQSDPGCRPAAGNKMTTAC